MSTPLKAGYKQTEVGVIPEEWGVVKLSQIARIQGGIAKNSNIKVTNAISVHYLRVANVQDGFLDLSFVSKIEISKQDLSRYSVLLGDILMNEGGDLDKLGRGAVWTGDFFPCVHQNHVFVVRCGSEVVPEYLNVWTETRTARNFFLLAGKQTTNLASISKSSLGQLPIALPSKKEQTAIATVLSDVDALIASLNAQIAKKRDIKTATMQQLLTGKQRLAGFGEGKGMKSSELGGIPEDWEVVQLKQVLKVRHGKSQYNVIVPDGEYPILASGGEIGRSHTALYSKPSVLIGRKGTIDKPRFIDKPFWTVDTLFYTEIFEKNDPKFIFYKFCLIDWASKNEASGVPSLSSKTIESVNIALPVQKEEQLAIAGVLSAMDEDIAALEQRLAKTKALKQGMMQELLTGRTRLV